MKKDAPGMKGLRSRNEHGPLRKTNGTKHVGTLEAQYNVNFGVRSDMKTDTLLEKLKVSSVKKALAVVRKRK